MTIDEAIERAIQRPNAYRCLKCRHAKTRLLGLDPATMAYCAKGHWSAAAPLEQLLRTDRHPAVLGNTCKDRTEE